MDRIVHLITSECEIYASVEGDMVRVRITEKDPELPNATSFEIEGDPECIAEALATAASVCCSIHEHLRKDPN